MRVYSDPNLRKIADGTVQAIGATIQHNSSSGKVPCVVQAYDQNGLWHLVQYSSGPWVNQQNWVPNWLLTST